MAGLPSSPKTSLPHLSSSQARPVWNYLYTNIVYSFQEVPRCSEPWMPTTGEIKCLLLTPLLLPTPGLETCEPTIDRGYTPPPEAKPPALPAPSQQHLPHPQPQVWSSAFSHWPELLLLPVPWPLQAWEQQASIPQLLSCPSVSLWRNSCTPHLCSPKDPRPSQLPLHSSMVTSSLLTTKMVI